MVQRRRRSCAKRLPAPKKNASWVLCNCYWSRRFFLHVCPGSHKFVFYSKTANNTLVNKRVLENIRIPHIPSLLSTTLYSQQLLSSLTNNACSTMSSRYLRGHDFWMPLLLRMQLACALLSIVRG